MHYLMSVHYTKSKENSLKFVAKCEKFKECEHFCKALQLSKFGEISHWWVCLHTAFTNNIFFLSCKYCNRLRDNDTVMEIRGTVMSSVGVTGFTFRRRWQWVMAIQWRNVWSGDLISSGQDWDTQQGTTVTLGVRERVSSWLDIRRNPTELHSSLSHFHFSLRRKTWDK